MNKTDEHLQRLTDIYDLKFAEFCTAIGIENSPFDDNWHLLCELLDARVDIESAEWRIAIINK